MVIHSATFTKSSSKVEECPQDNHPEYAFIGRSNVGKSSLINAMLNHKDLAKTSGRPGKTQLINHFEVNESWYLVDLPGYGFAKASKKSRATWQVFIKNYLNQRKNLVNTFVLVDVRHEVQKIDLDFMIQLAEWQLPFTIVFTKADKLKEREVNLNVKYYIRELLNYWEEAPMHFVSSAEKKKGMDNILSFIEQYNEIFHENYK